MLGAPGLDSETGESTILFQLGTLCPIHSQLHREWVGNHEPKLTPDP
jgi:hypothetical protein